MDLEYLDYEDQQELCEACGCDFEVPGYCEDCNLAPKPKTERKPPLQGTWRHSNGVICNGTLRIAQESFDTSPAPEYRDEVLDWMCETLNKAVEDSQRNSTEPNKMTGSTSMRYTYGP